MKSYAIVFWTGAALVAVALAGTIGTAVTRSRTRAEAPAAPIAVPAEIR